MSPVTAIVTSPMRRARVVQPPIGYVPAFFMALIACEPRLSTASGVPAWVRTWLLSPHHGRHTTHQHAQPDLACGLDRADPRMSLEVLQVWLHDLVQHLVRGLVRVDGAASPLRPGAISGLTQVERAQLVGDVLGHGMAIIVGQEISSQLFRFCQQFGDGPAGGRPGCLHDFMLSCHHAVTWIEEAPWHASRSPSA